MSAVWVFGSPPPTSGMVGARGRNPQCPGSESSGHFHVAEGGGLGVHSRRGWWRHRQKWRAGLGGGRQGVQYQALGVAVREVMSRGWLCLQE